jgi:hypothetical protein
VASVHNVRLLDCNLFGAERVAAHFINVTAQVVHLIANAIRSTSSRLSVKPIYVGTGIYRRQQLELAGPIEQPPLSAAVTYERLKT